MPLSTPNEISPRPYQSAAIANWLENQGCGILHMATGTGKTITSLVAASKLANALSNEIALVVVAPYQHLVDQWTDELTKFGATPLRAYRSRHRWLSEASSQVTEFNTGARDLLCFITTQDTFASEHFQSLVSRLPGSRTLLIVDEVHHVGSPHYRKALTEAVEFRMGLSATPHRFYDDEGTDALDSYFDGIVYSYDLERAIDEGYLCKYYYVPHIVELTEDENEQYQAISRAIAQIIERATGDIGDIDLQDDPELRNLLIKRARLVATAENKIALLEDLVRRQQAPSEIDYTLVYCGIGNVGPGDDEESIRQIRAVTKLLGNDLDMRIHQFTYEESQSERQRLLDAFERGELQALVAIRCLDEGVDVPATKTAYMLASSTNPRQFVQRRGRILRPHPGKEYAIIHDVITRPPSDVQYASEGSVFETERGLIKKELRRVSEFTATAMNHPDADLDGIPTTPASLMDLRKDFNLLDT